MVGIVCVVGALGERSIGGARVEPTALACSGPGHVEAHNTLAASERAGESATDSRAEDSVFAWLRAHASDQRPGRAAPPTYQPASMEAYAAWTQMIARELPHVERDDYGKWYGYCPADFDKNNVVDTADAAMFARLWQDESHELTGWADVNGDGWIDAGDVIEFMHRYIEQDCDPAQKVIERSAWC